MEEVAASGDTPEEGLSGVGSQLGHLLKCHPNLTASVGAELSDFRGYLGFLAELHEAIKGVAARWEAAVGHPAPESAPQEVTHELERRALQVEKFRARLRTGDRLLVNAREIEEQALHQLQPLVSLGLTVEAPSLETGSRSPTVFHSEPQFTRIGDARRNLRRSSDQLSRDVLRPYLQNIVLRETPDLWQHLQQAGPLRSTLGEEGGHWLSLRASLWGWWREALTQSGIEMILPELHDPLDLSEQEIIEVVEEGDRPGGDADDLWIRDVAAPGFRWMGQQLAPAKVVVTTAPPPPAIPTQEAEPQEAEQPVPSEEEQAVGTQEQETETADVVQVGKSVRPPDPTEDLAAVEGLDLLETAVEEPSASAPVRVGALGDAFCQDHGDPVAGGPASPEGELGQAPHDVPAPILDQGAEEIFPPALGPDGASRELSRSRPPHEPRAFPARCSPQRGTVRPSPSERTPWPGAPRSARAGQDALRRSRLRPGLLLVLLILALALVVAAVVAMVVWNVVAAQ